MVIVVDRDENLKHQSDETEANWSVKVFSQSIGLNWWIMKNDEKY